MMLTPEQLEDASAHVLAVRNQVLQLLAATPVPASLDMTVGIMVTIDGLVAAAAMSAEGSGILPTKRERRKFAEQLAAGFLKAMDAARDELAGNDNDQPN